ncbi:hypothetical protein Q5A_021675 [Serratia inhibens PRI-2C]|nr:hypothetical protein Q5A_021675 [Serratia inhibens PRI-2C]
MYLTEELLVKLNHRRENIANQSITLSDIMVRSFAEVRELAGDSLSWGEQNFLYQQAQKALKENQMTESRILSRANPQLANAVRLGIRESTDQRSYDDLFGGRAGKFVKPGSVASMFSPAGYLTELYREARKLHPASSEFNLDRRRPDLAWLALSQSNLDDELSTLSLSNELLLSNIRQQEDTQDDAVLERLSTYRHTGMTPYHLPFEKTRQAVLLQDEEFTAFQRNPGVAASMDTHSMLALKNGISPALYNILTEEITADNADELFKRNFPEETQPEMFSDLGYIARYYDLTPEEVSRYIPVMLLDKNMLSEKNLPLYSDNIHTGTFVDSEGKIAAYRITKSNIGATGFHHYWDLICRKDNTFYMSCSFKTNGGSVSVRRESPTVELNKIKRPTNAGVNYTSPDFQLPFSSSLTIKLFAYRYDGGESSPGVHASAEFTCESAPLTIFALKLNKAIRLCQATGLSPAELDMLVCSDNLEGTINKPVLGTIFYTLRWRQGYGLAWGDAQVLAGSDIGLTSEGGDPAAFTRLFNTPPLNGQVFFADGATVKLKPSDITDSFRTGVMKRAFRVNDTELYSLWCRAQGSDSPADFTCTLDNLSALYRVKLLADAHGVSLTELGMLLSVSPYATTHIAGLSGEALSGLVGFLAQYTQWLRAQGWTVSELYLTTTDRYSTALSPDIENLISTLKDGLAGQDIGRLDEAELIRVTAPFIAAANQLDSAELATAVLQWLAQLKPQGLTITTFLGLVIKENLAADESAKLVAFCQVMGQLALIVRELRLTSGEISLAVTQPEKIRPGMSSLPHDIATIHILARFHNWLQSCGTSATEILSALGKGTLIPAQLAQAMTLDEQMVIQGLAQHDDKAGVFSSWTATDVTLQWVDAAGALGITPAGVATLLSLKYTDSAPQPPYADWVAISQTLQSGLNGYHNQGLQAVVDESLSGAVSAYVLKNIAPYWVTDRNKLYSWLLLDNQISAQVKTTRLAEAIAGVQLYVNRALSGQEEEVDSGVQSRRFFTDWDSYNKRYSTWAGVSQLVYYPENYVDPTLRIGQTGMMDEMLQTLSQSQLNSDSVENAFKTYMTRFEEIANLDVISGYHDGVSDQEGMTYLIGRSAIGDYYWRSADIGLLSGGKLPANAWREWKKINTAISAVNNLVRPVIFQSRLYILWVESREVATTSSTPVKSLEYTLKYAHILHDGSWSAPVSVTPAAGVLPPAKVDIDKTGMYCARDVEQEMLHICFYQKQDNYNKAPQMAVTSGLLMQSDGSVTEMGDNGLTEIVGYVYRQMDSTAEVRLNTPYARGESYVNMGDFGMTTNIGGDRGYTIITQHMLTGLKTPITGNNVNLSFNTGVAIGYPPAMSARARRQVSLFKKVRKVPGDVYYVAKTLNTGQNAQREKHELEVVYQYDDRKVVFYAEANSSYTPGPGAMFYKPHYAVNTGTMNWTSVSGIRMNHYLGFSDTWWNPISEVNVPTDNLTFCRSNPFPTVGPDFTFSTFEKVDTAVLLEGVTLQVDDAVFKANRHPKNTFDESIFEFGENTAVISLDRFRNNTYDADFLFVVRARDGQRLGQRNVRVTLVRVLTSSLPIITLKRTATFAQYLQYGVYRIRVNTLFAKQLVARANAGLNTVLSMATQQLQEPQLGKGFYADFVLPPYDKNVHGNSRAFTLNLKHVVDDSAHVVYSGQLSDGQLNVKLFVPLDNQPLSEDLAAKVFLRTEKQNDGSSIGAHFSYVSGTELPVEIDSISKIDMFDHVGILTDETEPMDFSGANALYFWEMFYYVPMMVFRRLLQENNFSAATQWIKYVWSPEGYLLGGQPAPYQWNVRPLEEDTVWNANPLDTVDPDAVAQADPMHYKVATFMGMLDLLIARGDAAYRLLERDTLNEAKMWYVQALNILGDESYVSADAGWASPALGEAADQTRQVRVLQALEAIRQGAVEPETDTANSLIGLFLPQQNEKLKGYWQTLAQRLYNLRHHLSIDGQPLSLAIYAAPADPTALLTAAVNASQGNQALPPVAMPLYRFPVMLESARGMVWQLTQFGNALLSISERQDGEALSELLQTQGAALMLQSLSLQEKILEEIDADRLALEQSRDGAQQRLQHYTALHNEDVSAIEKRVMDLYTSSSSVGAGANALHMAAAGMDLMPNIYGFSVGGSRFGALSTAFAIGAQITSDTTRIAADRLGQSEAYRRRRQDWEIQRNTAESEVKQIDASLAALAVRREAATLQKIYLETQQSQIQVQLAFLQNKFTCKALYSWLRGKLAAIYHQFYDLTVSRCLMAQEAYKWEFGLDSAAFIRPGAWQGAYAGLMAGETLMLSLGQMEQARLQKIEREREVTRTLCLSEVYAGLAGNDKFTFVDKVIELVSAGKGGAGTSSNGLRVENKQLLATLKLSDLNIRGDYPDSLGKTRRIKQISVTLPALVGPYQDVRAVLSYGGSLVLPQGCNAVAVSHGMNDSGQFQLDFNDSRWLPFEGIPVNDTGTLTLSFPDVDSKQQALLLSLTDIILHIRYTIID